MYIHIQEFMSVINPEKDGIIQILSPQFRTAAHRKFILPSAATKARIHGTLADYYLKIISGKNTKTLILPRHPPPSPPSISLLLPLSTLLL
jgi:hypothetical protein